MDITYSTDRRPHTADIIRVYNSSGINRPTHDADRIARMYAGSNLVVTAWHDDQLVGIARSVTDHCYCCYLSELAVSEPYQHAGIGKKLVALTKEAIGEECMLLLLAAPSAMEYYPKIGMDKLDNAFMIRRSK
jgi:N-acetylglutamate synthase-like GNAT family acetyltransferase